MLHNTKPVEVLIVDDDPGDVDLMRETLDLSKLTVNVQAIFSGEEALSYLHKEGGHAVAVTPDLILLDLNMPRKDGRKVLEEIKSDDALKHIPVVILTTSSADEDIAKCYELGASCYVVKPLGLGSFEKVVKSIEDFWLTFVKFPPPREA